MGLKMAGGAIIALIVFSLVQTILYNFFVSIYESNWDHVIIPGLNFNLTAWLIHIFFYIVLTGFVIRSTIWTALKSTGKAIIGKK